MAENILCPSKIEYFVSEANHFDQVRIKLMEEIWPVAVNSQNSNVHSFSVTCRLNIWSANNANTYTEIDVSSSKWATSYLVSFEHSNYWIAKNTFCVIQKDVYLR